MNWWIVGGVVWVICGVFAYGLSCGYWVGRFGLYKSGAIFGSIFFLCGPFGLAVTWTLSEFGKYGPRFRRRFADIQAKEDY